MKKIEVKLPTGETREIEPSSESYVYRSVTDGNRLFLEWSEGVYRDYPVGLTAHVDGYDYTLYYPVEVRKVNTELLEYCATLHGREEELKMTKMKDVGSDTPLLSFVLTGKPTDFVRFVRRSMGEGWSVGQVIEGSERTLAFRHESCHDALARIAEEYHTEWHVDGTAISLSRLEVGREQPVALSYGMGKGFRSGVGRRSDGEETPIGRLFVDGGMRNIDPSKYGALTLRLPKGATYEYRGVTYRTDPTGSYITGASGSRTEGSYDGTDVYPRRVGRVTRVEVTKEGLVDIIDSTIPETLNYNDYRIGEEKAVIVFLSGMLTGREIEIEQTAKALSGYLHEERRFRLVSSEQDGQQMPGGSYMPKEGDTYAVYGISLPEEYVRTAEEELFHEACRYLSEEERERFRFDGQLDPVFAHREWGRIGGLIVPGGFVHFSDKQFYPRGSDIRIVSVRHPIGQPWAAELTLSGGPTSTGYLGSRLGRLEAEEILRRREEERRSRLQRQDYAQAVEAIGMISRAVKEVEGYTARIKPSVVETMGLLIGSEAGHFDFVEAVGSTKSVPFVPVVEAEAVVLPSSVLRHQTLGVKALTNKHRAEDFRYWTLPEYTSPALSDGTESYYIYAKVEREGSMGVFLLSREPISMEKVTGYYHLLVGTVSSVVDGSRAYNRLYGYSMLTPGALTVGAIESGNGNMRIDLETGQIIVKHLRIGPPDASKDLQTELDTIRKTPGPQGLQGQQGPKGEDGIPGKDGKDGLTAYTHIAYADTAQGGGFSQSPAGKSYVGMYVDHTATDSTSPSAYAWSLIKGADGRDGTPGMPGKDGRTPYLHIAYADTAAGGGFSQSPAGKAYIGQYTDYTQPDSSDPSRYTWSRIKGDKGDPGKDVDPKVLNDLKAAVDDARRKLDDTVTKSELDGVVSAQEKHDIQAAKAALDAAKKAYDDAVKRAKELDSEIQVGGRNLLLGTDWRSVDRLASPPWGNALAVKKDDSEGVPYVTYGYAWRFFTKEIRLDPSTNYTISFLARRSGAKVETTARVYVGGGIDATDGVTDKWQRFSHTFTTKQEINENVIRFLSGTDINGAEVAFAQLKLERGTVATDWTPAPEDLQAAMEEVAQAKAKLAETRSKAYADGKITATEQLAINKAAAAYKAAIAKARELDDALRGALSKEINVAKEQATKAQQSTDKLRGYVDGAFRDGVVDDAEAKAIKTYINEVEAMWSSAFGAFERVYVNPFLTSTPKTALSDAKITLAGAKDNLISQIRRAISDGKATRAEATETERLYNVYKGALRDFHRALTSAEEAIRDAGKTTGGRNLLLGTDWRSVDRLVSPPWGTALAVKKDDNEGVSYVTYGYAWGFFTKEIRLDPSTNYTISFLARRSGAKVETTARVYVGGGIDATDGVTDKWQRFSHTFTTKQEINENVIRFLSGTDINGAEVAFAQLKLERGNVATDWIPAPEDLQAEIDAERKAREAAVREIATGLANTDTLVSALEKAQNKLDQGVLTKADTKDIQYLLDSLKNGDTQVAGGLVLSNDIILSDPNSKDVTATISGTQTEGAKVMRLGISYTCDPDKKTTVSGANSKWGVNLYSELQKLESDSDRIRKLDELGFTIVGGRSLGWPQWEICKAADAKEGGEATALANDGTGHLRDLYFGGEEIGFGPPDRRYMQIGGTARSEYDMVNASTEIHKSQVPGTTVYKAGETLLDNFYLPGSNSELKYTAMISARADAEAQRRIVVEGGGPDGNPHYGGGYERPKRVVYYDRCSVTTSAYLRVTITRGGEEVYSVTSPTVTASAVATGGRSADDSEITHDMRFDSGSQELAVTLTVPANIIRPSDFAKLTLVCSELRADRGGGGAAYASNIVSYLPYDTSTPMVSVTKDRAAFFYGRSRYLLFNYLPQYVVKLVGDMLLQGNLRLKGKLEADEVDAPGAPLCGGMVYENGTFSKSFGRYVNKSWEARPRVEYDYDASTYTVYHSIGSSSYVPIVTAVGSNAGNERWNLSVRVYNVSPYRFEVKLLTNNDNPTQNGFSYVCFKTD